MRRRRWAGTTALHFFETTEDLMFAVNAQGIVRGSCNPAALAALQRHDSIFPNGGIGVLRRAIQKGTTTVHHGHLGDQPAVWKATHIPKSDVVLVICSLELGRLNEEATVDPLTGLANKRQFLRDLVRRHTAESLTALLLVDIDHFKQCNDTYGHEMGDLILAAVGRVIAQHTRPEDRSYRFGGEELAIRMEGLISNREFSLAVVRSRAEAIRTGVARLRFDGVEKPITVSIGVTLYPNTDGDGRLAEADRALYWAKNRGRNQVIFHEEVPADWQPTVTGSPTLPEAVPTASLTNPA